MYIGLMEGMDRSISGSWIEGWMDEWIDNLRDSKFNIRNVNYARATSFIFDTGTGVLVKVSKFLRQKMSRHEGNSNPQHLDSYRML